MIPCAATDAHANVNSWKSHYKLTLTPMCFEVGLVRNVSRHFGGLIDMQTHIHTCRQPTLNITTTGELVSQMSNDTEVRKMADNPRTF